MSEDKKFNPVEEQKRRQQELIELKLKKQEFQENPEEFVHEGVPEFQQSTASKVYNFWYYARFSVIMLVILAIILTVGVTQCANRPKYDMTIVLYMKRAISSTMVENLTNIAELYCEDRNGDGEKNVLILDCAVTEEDKLGDTGMSKTTRLQANFANEEAIVYIMDKEALVELSSLDDGAFIDGSLKLPEFEGRAFKLNGSIFDSAFNTADEHYANSFEYYIARRVVSGTQIEKKKNAEVFSNQANEFIRAVTTDPLLFPKKEESTDPFDDVDREMQ